MCQPAGVFRSGVGAVFSRNVREERADAEHGGVDDGLPGELAGEEDHRHAGGGHDAGVVHAGGGYPGSGDSGDAAVREKPAGDEQHRGK